MDLEMAAMQLVGSAGESKSLCFEALRAAKEGDFFVTVTGCKDVITKEHIKVMKDGAVLANAGHFDVEINIPDLEELSVVPSYEVRKNIRTYTMSDGSKINLLGEGRLVNFIISVPNHKRVVSDEQPL